MEWKENKVLVCTAAGRPTYQQSVQQPAVVHCFAHLWCMQLQGGGIMMVSMHSGCCSSRACMLLHTWIACMLLSFRCNTNVHHCRMLSNANDYRRS